MSYFIYLKQIFVSKNIVRCLLSACVPALLFYVVSLLVLTASGFSFTEILRDPAQQCKQSSWLGFLSNIGVWLWVSSAAICIFSYLTGDFQTKANQRRLLLLVGILSFILAVDDFFMLHDQYFSQKFYYAFYAVYAVTLLKRHYQTIIDIDGFAFILAGVFLALSILTDLMQLQIPLGYEKVQVLEEGFKFIGGATWFYFCFRVASLRPVVANASSQFNTA